MSKKPLGVAVLGMGWMGEAHSLAYRALPFVFPDARQVRLVACADENSQRAEASRARFGFTHAFTDWREAIAAEGVDIVDVTLPNRYHLPAIEEAAAHGKAINCEKPVGSTPADTLRAAALAREKGIVSMTGYNYRWAPVLQTLARMLEEKRLGELRALRLRFFSCYAADPLAAFSWRFDRNYGTGAIADLMSHVADLALCFGGAIKEVCSTTSIFVKERPVPKQAGTHFSRGKASDPQKAVSNEDYAAAFVRFENGAHGTLECSRALRGPLCELALEVYGEKGAARWSFEDMNVLYLSEPLTHGEGYRRIDSSPDHPSHAAFNPAPAAGLGYNDLKTIEAYRFVQSVERGENDAVSLEHAARVARVLQAVESSAESRAWQQVEAL